MDESPSARSSRCGLALSVGVAFSPAIVDLVRSLGQVDGHVAILIGPLLAAMATRDQLEPARVDRRRGILLIGTGLALELLGIWLDFWTMARLGLPVAAVGVGWILGRPGPAQLALLFFAVPIPISISSLTTPWLESIYADLCVGLLHGVFGLDIQASGPLLFSAGWTLELYASDSGMWLAYVLAALGWYTGLRARRTLPWLLARATVGSLVGPPLQLLATFVAGALAAGGHVHDARSSLDWGLHALVVVCALMWVRRRSGTEPTTSRLSA